MGSEEDDNHMPNGVSDVVKILCGSRRRRWGRGLYDFAIIFVTSEMELCRLARALSVLYSCAHLTIVWWGFEGRSVARQTAGSFIATLVRHFTIINLVCANDFSRYGRNHLGRWSSRYVPFLPIFLLV